MLGYVRTTLSIKFHKILCISSGATPATNFFPHTNRQIHRETNAWTGRQTDIFQKYSNHVQDIPKRVIPSKTGNRKLARNQYFLLLISKKVKNY